MDIKIPNNNDMKVNVQSEMVNKNDKFKNIKEEKVKDKQSDEGVIYDKVTIEQLKKESDVAYQNLKRIVEDMLKRQGLIFQDLDLESEEDIKIDEEAKIEAQNSIKEGGEYSPDKVSDRVVKFAKAISGGDKSKLGLLRSAIEEGFEEAEKVFGKLPEISYETQDLIMKKLDEWEQE